MTIQQFRQSSPLVLRMRELLEDPTMQEALMALHDSNLPVDPADDADAIASVRRHSKAVGFNNCIIGILSMKDLIPLHVPEEQTTYEPDNQS